MILFVELIRLIKSVLVALISGVFILTAMTLVGVFVVGCGPTANKPNVEVIQDMMEQPALKAQDFHPYDREKSSMLVPPKGTWPKNRKPYPYWNPETGFNDAEAAGRELKNPYGSEASPEFTQLGKRHYTNYCVYCHGENLDGNGPVAEKWKPIVVPSLVSEKVRNFPDGRIFHIITAGQGLMGTYIHQVPEEKDRWAIVNYIRQIQQKGQ